MNILLPILLLTAVLFPFVSNAMDTVNTANAIKVTVDKVKWIGLYGSLLTLLKSGFTIDVYFKLDNPTNSDLKIDFIKLNCYIQGNLFAIINYTDPITIKGKEIVIKPIRIQSSTTTNMIDLVTALFASKQLPKSIHIKGTVSANTWKAAIDDDYNVIG